jgi:hypothetical protein
LIGVVDVQQNMFIVQILGISPGAPFDLTVIDRFQIRNSTRPDEHSGGLGVGQARLVSLRLGFARRACD